MDANKWAALALAAVLARCKAWAAAELEREAQKLQQAAKGLRK
jgi:uncharacterized protein GlcG (DUF336 family)